MLEYEVFGVTMKVNPEEKENFLNKYPSAVLVKTAGAEVGAAAPKGIAPITALPLGNTSLVSQEDDTFIERQFGKNWFTDFWGDLWRAGEQGFGQASQIGETFEVFNKGVDATDADIIEMINARKKAQGVGMTDEMLDFQKIYEEEGKGVWGFMKGVLNNPSVVPQIFISSMATLAGSALDSSEVATAALSSAAAGAGAGAAAGLAGGVLAPVTSTAGAITGGVSGLFGGLGGAMEAGLTFGELLEKELAKEGKSFELENVKIFLEDKEKLKDLKRKAVGRGLTIGAIESLTGGLAGRAGAAVKGFKGALTSIGIEAVGGGLGEIAGRKVADQEMDVAEIGFEAIGGTATAPFNLTTAILTSPTYKINGQKASRIDVLDQIDAQDSDFLSTNFNIKNDPELNKQIHNKRIRLANKAEIETRVTNKADLEKVLDLEQELNSIGSPKTIIGKKRKKELQEEINNIVERYDAITAVPKGSALEQFQNDLLKSNIATSITFAEDAKLKLGLDQITVKNTDAVFEYLAGKNINLTAQEINNIKTFGGFVIGKNIVINEEVAAKTGQINVGAHEILHGILEKYVGENQENVVENFKNVIGKEQVDIVEKELIARGYTTDEFNKEFLTVYSDAIATNKITYNENIFTQIGDFIVNNILRPLGFSKIGFESGEQVYNFMKEYQKGVSEGSLTKQIEKALGDIEQAQKITPEEILASRPESENARVDALVGPKDEAGNYTISNSEWKNSGIGTAYMEIINGNMLDGLIRSYAKDPNTNTILDNVYGRSIEQFIQDVKTGETTPGVTTLTDTIMNFNPEENNSLIGWINSQLRFRVGDVVKRYKETQLATGEMQEAAEITRAITAAPDAPAQIEEKTGPTIKPLNRFATTPELKTEYKSRVQDFVINNDMSGLTYKKLTDVAPDLTKRIFGPSRTDKGFFIKKNAKLLYELLPLAAGKMAGGKKGFGTATGIKRILLDNFYTKEGRATMAEGTAAGLEIRNKKPFNETAFLEVFGLLPNQKQDRNQMTAIQSLEAEIGKAITNSEVREALKNKEVENAIIQRIADGKSDILYSKISINSLDDGIKYANEIEEIIKADIFPLGLLGRNVVQPSNKEIGDPVISKYLKEKFKAINFGRSKDYGKVRIGQHMKDPITGKQTLSGILKRLKKDPQRITKYNAKTSKMFEDFWFSFRKAALKFPQYKETLMNMLYVSLDTRDHPHALGAEVVGYDKTAGQNIKLEYEHAVPVQYAANILGEAAFDPNVDYKKLFEAVKKNYKQVAFTDEIAKIINDLASKFTMPENWNVFIDSWTARYDVIKDQFDLNNIEWIADGNNPFLASKPNLNIDFNKILEESKGVPFEQDIPDILARQLGRKKDKFKPFVPYSAEDFEGLMYPLYGKGATGDKNAVWFKENLYKPLSEGLMQFDAAKQKALEQLKKLKKEIKNSGIDLSKESEVEGFTVEQAVRVRMWAKNGYNIPGINDNLQGRLIMAVRKDMDAMKLVEKLDALFPNNLYTEPENNWLAGSILTDVIEFQNTAQRKEFLQPFFDNVSEIIGDFGQGNKLTGPNVNKLRATFGNNYIKALENILTRIRSGRNRIIGPDDTTNSFMDWVNNSVGTIMFFNTRSALLQTISNFNYINWSDNNVLKAGQAWLNQKQFWKDFAFLYNSDFLKARRSGLRTDVNADEIAKATEGSSNKVKSALAAILKKGFLPTQIADSFAIAVGGASFYRNRLNKYLSEGMSQTGAENQTFLDFQELTESAQQSSRPDRISMQQAGPLGRVILAFQNTPMQYTRLIKKSVLDLINKRGDWKTNLSKILYYGAIQNIIFHSLQTALFALAFDDEEEDKVKERYFNIGNRVADTLLIGTGVYGAIAATTKNVILEVIEQEKGKKDFQKAAIASTALSPPINSKLQKLIRAGRRFTYKQEREKITEMGLDTKNPAVISAGEVLSAVFNLPADRAIRKWNNLVLAADSETELWQSIALALGYSEWDVKLAPSQQEPKINVQGIKPIQIKPIKVKPIKID